MRSWIPRGKPLQRGITICCLNAFLLFGYEQGVFGPILQNENWLHVFNHPSESTVGIIVSSYNLGCLLGCLINFVIAEHLGRRRTIWLAMGFVVTGTALQTSSFTIPHLVVGRVITGIGTGMKTSTVPMYQAELCPSTSRGRLVSLEVLFVGVGIVFAYWFGFGMSFVGGPLAWRLPVACQALFALVVAVLVFALPESPRWLHGHGRRQEALDVLCAVFDKPETDDFIVAEAAAIARAVEFESSSSSSSSSSRGSSLWAVFKQDEARTPYRVFLGWLIHMMNQASGINLVVYYIPTVLESNIGVSVQTSQILGGCINMALMLGTLIPSAYLDSMGRRRTMLAGCSVLGICMMLVAALLSQSQKPGGESFAYAAVAFFFAYMFTFGMSVHCVPWVYVPEILPLESRTQGTAIGVSSNWLWNFTVVMIAPIITSRLGWKAYLIFMATNLTFVPLIYFLYPETGNLRLEDVNLIFSEGGNPVAVARTMAKANREAAMAGVEMGTLKHEHKADEGVETIELATA